MNLKVNDKVIDLDFLRKKHQYAKIVGKSRQRIDQKIADKDNPLPFIQIFKTQFIYLPDMPEFQMANIVRLIAIDIEKNATHFKDEGETSRIFEYTSCFNLFFKVSVYCEIKIKIDFQEIENIVEVIGLENFGVMHSDEQKELVQFDMMLFEVELEKELNKIF